MSWTEKYRPKNLNDIKIEPAKLNELKHLVLEKKPAMLYGNSGTGKTCSVYALANELDYDVVEVNATDLRDKNNVDMIIGKASQQQSLFYSGKIILIDEVDALTGVDRGGATTILEVIDESKSPIILTANDAYDKKLSSIRKKCKLIEFDDVKVYDILDILKKILKKEGIKGKDELLLKIAKESKGDLRAAINDLQATAIGKEELDDFHISERDKKEDIFRILRTIFKKKDTSEIKEKIEDYDELLLWLEENLPKEYSGEDLEKGFDKLSKADIFRKRITKQQYWRFLVYIKELLTSGVALSKESENNRFTSYKRGQRILKYWIAKQKNLKKKEIADNLSKKIHMSSKKIMKDFYFYEIIGKKFSLE